ncbi:hypothetical protein ASE59_15025 [Sphingomonas sp. Leaf10]|nr:hypothetical protein ASE59_15025 [Sphingomonas sp. Leaf10]
MGQVVVRGTTWLLVILCILFGSPPDMRQVRPVAMLLLAAFVLVLVQLVPLPPSVWQMLPGRANLGGIIDPLSWRPLAIVPGAAWNAASSLIVPFAVLLFLAGMEPRERAWLPGILLGLAAFSMIIGLLQFSGAGFANPFINDTPGQVAGMFANRNHFALFLALGCLIAPTWAFGNSRPGWRIPIALGLLILFAMTILASGSRAGILVGVPGIGIGLFMARNGIRRMLRHAPRWMFPAILVGVVALIAIFILLLVAADRAVSIDRAFALDRAEDMRTRGLPTVLAMVSLYFPAGSGFGGFDPMFRMHEPFELLKPTYFNHAHNDFLEIALDGGLPGVLLLAAAIGWWLIASIRAWRGDTSYATARLGSALLLLIFMASMLDYPARTPMMMAVIVIAASWLNASADFRAKTAARVDRLA